MKQYFAVMTLALLCGACTETKVLPRQGNDPVFSRLRSSRFYFVDKSHFQIDYHFNKIGLIEKEVQIADDGSTLFETVYQYDNGKLIEQIMGTAPQVAAFTYTYDGDSLSFAEYKEMGSKPDNQHFQRTYAYPEPGLVVIKETDLVKSTSQHIYLYLKNQNIIKTRILDGTTGKVRQETVLEYDSHLNPYFQLTGRNDFSRFLSKNNVIAIKSVIEHGQPSNGVTAYSYEYSSAGLPIKKYHRSGEKRFLDQEFLYD